MNPTSTVNSNQTSNELLQKKYVEIQNHLQNLYDLSGKDRRSAIIKTILQQFNETYSNPSSKQQQLIEKIIRKLESLNQCEGISDYRHKLLPLQSE